MKDGIIFKNGEKERPVNVFLGRPD